jgi:hypothetical protein
MMKMSAKNAMHANRTYKNKSSFALLAFFAAEAVLVGLAGTIATIRHGLALRLSVSAVPVSASEY